MPAALAATPLGLCNNVMLPRPATPGGERISLLAALSGDKGQLMPNVRVYQPTPDDGTRLVATGGPGLLLVRVETARDVVCSPLGRPGWTAQVVQTTDNTADNPVSNNLMLGVTVSADIGSAGTQQFLGALTALSPGDSLLVLHNALVQGADTLVAAANSIPKINALLEEGDQDSLRSALKLMATSPHAEWVPTIRDIIYEFPNQVYQEAFTALCRINTQEARNALLALINKTDAAMVIDSFLTSLRFDQDKLKSDIAALNEPRIIAALCDKSLAGFESDGGMKMAIWLIATFPQKNAALAVKFRDVVSRAVSSGLESCGLSDVDLFRALSTYFTCIERFEAADMAFLKQAGERSLSGELPSYISETMFAMIFEKLVFSGRENCLALAAELLNKSESWSVSLLAINGVLRRLYLSGEYRGVPQDLNKAVAVALKETPGFDTFVSALEKFYQKKNGVVYRLWMSWAYSIHDGKEANYRSALDKLRYLLDTVKPQAQPAAA